MMKSHHRLVLYLFVGLLLYSLVLQPVSSQTEESDTNYLEDSGDQRTETVEAPLVGWYLIPFLGVLRRRRHDLQNRDYDTDQVLN